MAQKEIEPQLAGSKLAMQKLADLKRYWKVSIQAILYWATTIKSVIENQARYLWFQFNALRIRIKEPIEIAVEKPSLLPETQGQKRKLLKSLSKIRAAYLGSAAPCWRIKCR